MDIASLYRRYGVLPGPLMLSHTISESLSGRARDALGQVAPAMEDYKRALHFEPKVRGFRSPAEARSSISSRIWLISTPKDMCSHIWADMRKLC
jgi:hypothetical protein